MIIWNILGETEVIKPESEIRECPFCGMRNFIITSRQIFEDVMQERGQAVMSLRCKCGAVFMDYTYDVDAYDSRVNIILEKWNRRSLDNEQTDDGK